MKQLTQSEFKKGARNYENIASPQQDAEHEQIKFMAVDEFGNLQYSQDGVNFETIQSDGKVKPLTSLTPVTSESELPEGNEGDAYAVLTNGNLPLMYYVYTTEWENRGVFVDNTLVYCNNLLYIYNESFNGYFAKTSYTDTAELTNGANFVNTTQLNALSDRVTVVENDKLNKSTATNIVYGTDANGDQTRLNYGSGASNIVQRDVNSQVDVPETPTADGHATSKKYVDTQVGTKQDTLSSTQLNAVNSGIDSTKVSQITTNANDIADLQTAVSGKQNTLTAGDNIDITNDTISAKDVVTTNTAQTITGKKTIRGELEFQQSTDSGGTTKLTIKNDNGYNAKIRMGNTENIRLMTGGTYFGATAAPISDNATDLGASNTRWKDGYFAGVLSDGTNSIAVADIASKNVVMFKPLSLSTTTLTDDQITQLRTYNCILTNDLTLGNTSLKAGAILTIPFEYSNSLRGIAIYNNRIMTYYINLTSKQISDGAKDIVISQVANINTDKVTIDNYTINKDSFGQLQIGNNNATSMQFDGGTVRAQNLVPMGNNSKDLGNSSQKWKDLHLAGNLTDGTNSVSIADITDIQSDVSDIEDKIPAQASSSNQLADKDFVNSSINAFAAYYITKNAQGDPFATKAELNNATTFYSGGSVRVPTTNDYCIVLADESQQSSTGVDPTTRYTYQGGQWEFQYKINDTPLTAAQLSALNSGITSTLVGQITTNQTNISGLSTDKADKTYVDGNFVSVNAQTLTDAQKAQARANIGAGGASATEVIINGVGVASVSFDSDPQTQINAKVTGNTAITGATKTKITYDSKGLVTAGSDLEASDIPNLTLSKITDVTATATELNYVDGVTSAIQTQLDGKQATIDSSHKLSADLTEDGTTNKVFTATEQTKLSGIESGAEVNDVIDVQVNGTSILSSKVANIVTNTAYDATNNKIATMSDIPAPITVDSSLSTSSTNPVRNSVITNAFKNYVEGNYNYYTNQRYMVVDVGSTSTAIKREYLLSFSSGDVILLTINESEWNATYIVQKSDLITSFTKYKGSGLFNNYQWLIGIRAFTSSEFTGHIYFRVTALSRENGLSASIPTLNTLTTYPTAGTIVEITPRTLADTSSAQTLSNKTFAGVNNTGDYKIGSSNSTIASVSGTNLTLGNSSLATNIAGSGTRPTYNSNSLALYNDLPANITITTTAGSQSVSDGTNTLNFGSNAFNSTTIPTSYVSSVNGNTGAITDVLTASSGLPYTTTTPTAANTDGLKIVVLSSEPSTKYSGWLYIITS